MTSTRNPPSHRSASGRRTVLALALVAALALGVLALQRMEGASGIPSGVAPDPASTLHPDGAKLDEISGDLGSANAAAARTSIADDAKNPSTEALANRDASGVELEVLALRSNGEPAAGLQVALRATLYDGTARASADVAATDAAGRVRFPWERVLLSGAHEAGLEALIVARERPIVRFSSLSLDEGEPALIVGPDRLHFRIAPPLEPVVIQLPPTSAIEVRTWLAPGEPLAFRGSVQLMTSLKFGLPRAFASASLEQGAAQFGYVDPMSGYDIEVSSRSPWWGSERVEGPLAPGALVQVDLYPSPSSALYSARLVSDKGVVLNDFQIKLRLGQVDYATHATSDADGKVLFGLPAREAGKTRALTVEAQGWKITNSQHLTLDVPAANAGQRVDLGDLVLDEPEVWYSGSVVDVAGEPIPGANVALNVVARPSEGQQRTQRAASTHADEQGRFWLPAPSRSIAKLIAPPERTLQLEARSFHVHPASLEVGTEPVKNARLVLSPIRSVSLFVHDLRSLAQSPQIIARRLDQPDATIQSLAQRLGSEAFRGNLPAGTWTIAIHTGPYVGLPILETAPFVVEAPTPKESTSPAQLRLEDISLKGRWRKATIRIEDQEGQPIPSVTLTLTCTSIARSGRAQIYGEPETELILPNEPVTITASAQGYRDRTFTLVGAKQTITLEPKPR